MMGMTWFIDEQFAYDNMLTARDFYLLNLVTNLIRALSN